VRGRNHRLIRRFLVPLTGFLLVLGVPATGPAQAPGVGALKQKSEALAAESRQAVLDLYALESRLRQARSDLARIDARAAALEARLASARRRYRAAQRTLIVAQRRLGLQLRLLYEHDQPDPIAVILGATSLNDAIDGLESIHRTAHATDSVIAEARTARARIERVRAGLTAQAAATRDARARAAATAEGLAQARAERTAYLERLRREQALTAAQIADLEQRAREAEARARELTKQAAAAAAEAPSTTTASPDAAPATTGAAVTTTGADTTTDSPGPSTPPPAPVESVAGGDSPPPTSAPAPPRPGGTMTVYATGYCLRGTTATGLPVGPGIVAVDPTVIPLGTRMTIPGYGEGVAADTGGEIKGRRIDVWIASCAKAAAFGRTVTITFH
jgi:3D (Asp-Asp-Asp) domain-containing protein/peptidoglycan hydrolase CwlO-like protein